MRRFGESPSSSRRGSMDGGTRRIAPPDFLHYSGASATALASAGGERGVCAAGAKHRGGSAATSRETEEQSAGRAQKNYGHVAQGNPGHLDRVAISPGPNPTQWRMTMANQRVSNKVS